MNMIMLFDSHPFAKMLLCKHFQPQKVWILHTDTDVIEEYKTDFKKWMIRRKIDVRVIEIDETNPESIERILRDLLGSFGSSESIIDITGANPVMCYAAANAIQDFPSQLVCLDDDTHDLITMPDGLHHSMDIRLTVPDCMDSTGREIVESLCPDPERPSCYWDLAEYMATNHESISRLLQDFARAYQQNARHPIHIMRRLSRSEGRLITELARLGWIEPPVQVTNGYSLILNPNSQIRHFLTGAWLELFVLFISDRFKPDDLRMGLKLRWDRDDPECSTHEIDLAYTIHNRLYVIECKAGVQLSRNNNLLAHHINRLATMRSYFGDSFCEVVLILAEKLAMNRVAWKRAEELGIHLLDQRHLANLEQHLAPFIRS